MPIIIEPRAYSGAQLTMNGVSQPITVHAKYNRDKCRKHRKYEY